jgi:hypothetical protein
MPGNTVIINLGPKNLVEKDRWEMPGNTVIINLWPKI